MVSTCLQVKWDTELKRKNRHKKNLEASAYTNEAIEEVECTKNKQGLLIIWEDLP